MKNIKDAILDKDPQAKETVTRLWQYYAQLNNNFAVKELPV